MPILAAGDHWLRGHGWDNVHPIALHGWKRWDITSPYGNTSPARTLKPSQKRGSQGGISPQALTPEIDSTSLYKYALR